MKYGDLTSRLDLLSDLIADIKAYAGLSNAELAEQHLLRQIISAVELPFDELDLNGVEDDLFVDVGELFVIADGGTDTTAMLADYKARCVMPEIDEVRKFLDAHKDVGLPKGIEQTIAKATRQLNNLKTEHPNNISTLRNLC